MPERVGHLRGIEGGGEGADPTPTRYTRPQAIQACADPAADVDLIFAAFPTSRDHGEWEFSRALARRLVADIGDDQAGGPAELFMIAALVDGWHSQHLIWDKHGPGHPRQLHIWPDGHLWGRVPPLKRGRSPTYTACGEPLDPGFFFHERARRGEWREQVDALRAIEAHADAPPGWVYPSRVPRLCEECTAYADEFPECLADQATGPVPAFRYAQVRAAATHALADRLRDRPPRTLETAREVALQLYREAAVDLVARLAHDDGEPALRRMFGEDLDGYLRRPEVITVYDDLLRYTRHLCRRPPHELLDEVDWRKLLAAAAPWAREGDESFEDRRRFEGGVRALIQERALEARRERLGKRR